MKKSDKKIEKQLQIGLTDICENTLKSISGFQWLTHVVDYNQFPKSLKIILVFGTREDVMLFENSPAQVMVEQTINRLMLQLNIKLKSLGRHILFDNERDCALQHSGDWSIRLRTVS